MAGAFLLVGDTLEVYEIVTKRLVLRPVEVADALDLAEAYSDYEMLYGYDARDVIVNADDVLRLIEQEMILFRQNKCPPLMVLEERKSAKAIGTIRFHRIRDGIGEIGYLLTRAYHHQGYMHEALTAMVDFGFTTLDLERIEARYASENIASSAVLKHCHFVVEGCLRKGVYLNDHRLHDLVICSILREEYERRKTCGIIT